MTPEDVCFSDASRLAGLIRVRDISPVEVMQSHLDRINEINPAINAVVTMASDAMEVAKRAESAIVSGECWGPLHGVPFTVKDCFDTSGLRTTRGSKLFEDFVPSSDATVVARLKQAGAILIGKTNTPEFAMWWETDNVIFGRTENPWMLGRTPGGSSGGEASAIASGLTPMGMGSDLGGSIRLPAAFCGIVGLKATHGLIPFTGHWPDVGVRHFHAGPLARSVKDVELLLSVLAGPDYVDPYAVMSASLRVHDVELPLPRLKVGWCAQGPFSPVAQEVESAVVAAALALEEMGCDVEQVGLEGWESYPPQEISSTLLRVESEYIMAPVIRGREEDLAPSMKRRSTFPMPSIDEYAAAIENNEHLRRCMARYFAEYDLLICPVSPVPPVRHNLSNLDIDGKSVPARNTLRATIPFNLTGSPAVSLPFRWSSEGLPIGIQLVGRHLDEPGLLHVAAALEALREAPNRRPSVR